ncbi:MAG: PAS domain-containing protein [Methanoregula sp.]|nr:PAS domain-containing protein [Methanoregula sp.]
MSEKPLIALTLVFMGMFAIMAIFEIIKQVFLPAGDLWQSPFATILVAGTGAAFIAFFPLRALRDAESRFRAIFDKVQTGIVIIDPATHRIVEVNPVAADLIGLPKEKIIRNMCNDFICPNEQGKCPITDLHQTVDNSERFLQNANGEMIPILKTVAPVEFLGKTYLIESIADISKRKKIEAALNKSEERYRNIVQTQTEFICRFRPDGTHIFANEAYCRYFNMRCTDLMGHRFKPKIPPEDQPKVREFFASLTPDHPSGIIEHRIIMPDGEIRWQRWSEQGIFDESGAVIEYQSVGRDITPLKEAEAEIKKSETLMRSILHGSPGLQFVIDADHRVLFWNRILEIYTGVKERDVIGTRDAWKAFYEEERPTLADVLVDGNIETLPGLYSAKIRKSTRVDGAYEAVSYFPRMSDGVWLFFTSSPLRDEQGMLLGAVETAIDITGLKKAEAEVKASHERYLAYIKEAAMRLKTPVEVVGGNLAAMVADIRSGENDPDVIALQLNLQVKNLDQIRYNIIHLNTTILEGFGEISEESKKFLTE